MGYDLTLQQRGVRRDREVAEGTMRALLREVPAAAGWEPRLAFAPVSDDDCEAVQDLIEEDEDAAAVFNARCATLGVPSTVGATDREFCAEFLDEQWGVTLGTVTIPSDAEGARSAYAALVAFARKQGLTLWDPQAGDRIHLAEPGALPPQF